jgi:hypothetical protein
LGTSHLGAGPAGADFSGTDWRVFKDGGPIDANDIGGGIIGRVNMTLLYSGTSSLTSLFRLSIVMMLCIGDYRERVVGVAINQSMWRR